MDEKKIAAWYPVLFRTALRLTGSVTDAADLTQQAFCRAIEHWDSFQHNCSPLTWMYRILVNGMKDWSRRETTRRAAPLDEWAPLIEDPDGPGVPETAARNEQLMILRKAIGALAQPMRQAFVATVLDGYSYREAAELLGVPVGTVASRVNAARTELSQTMRQRFPEA
ncbi:MAG: RNA polymerase sigma factor [Planctomycetota bacterium]|nr:RNA polymerase sigma factor [Planctomycetota bacterium]